MPSSAASRPGSDRTWNAFQGITFTSSHESTPSQGASHIPSQATNLQKDSLCWTEPQTQRHFGSQHQNGEGFGNTVLTRGPMQLLETQIGCAQRSSSPKDDGHSSESAHSESCPPFDDGLFRTPLGFHIPAEKLRFAMLAEPLSIAAYWRHTLYQGPGGDKVKVHYCKTREATEKVAQLFLDERIVGFDIEWKPNATATDGITKNVALIQIASEERVLLAHIAQYPNAATLEKDQQREALIEFLLESQDVGVAVYKQSRPYLLERLQGVAIKGDCTRLRNFLGIHSSGLFELSHLYKLVKFSSGKVKKINKTPVSLAQQVQEHLQLPLDKGEVTQYAASDSYAAFQLYHVLEAKRRALEPPPPRPAHAELNLPIRLANGQTVQSFDEGLESTKDASTDAPLGPSISIDELVQDFQDVAIQEPAPLYPQLPSHPPPSSEPSSATPSKKHLAPKIIEANDWVAEYINSRPATIKAKPTKAHLRAYYLWEMKSMETEAISALLRVEFSTVAVYVLQAIKIEHLGFGEERSRTLVPFAPKAFRDDYEMMISSRAKK
ncbi:MAG: hypothetical protein ASARMPREDX12_008674 [Alectoria sarmentosa]|nr:MAG: hypothetical protein ASARMPREDX12_008674 [Alectoria sarmentosa]